MKRREQKARIREIWQQTFADIDADDEAARAARVRDLCPCEFTWSVPLWDIIFAACEDPSPLVRVEALHVIQDAHEHGVSTAGGMALLHAARRDSAPQVRRFAADVLSQRSQLQHPRNRKRERIMQRITRRERVEDGVTA